MEWLQLYIWQEREPYWDFHPKDRSHDYQRIEITIRIKNN